VYYPLSVIIVSSIAFISDFLLYNPAFMNGCLVEGKFNRKNITYRKYYNFQIYRKYPREE